MRSSGRRCRFLGSAQDMDRASEVGLNQDGQCQHYCEYHRRDLSKLDQCILHAAALNRRPAKVLFPEPRSQRLACQIQGVARSRSVTGRRSGRPSGARAILGAAQLLVLGIVGQYVGRTLREARRRPSYAVAETEAQRARSAACRGRVRARPSTSDGLSLGRSGRSHGLKLRPNQSVLFRAPARFSARLKK
jgi:hypothetical protein